MPSEGPRQAIEIDLHDQRRGLRVGVQCLGGNRDRPLQHVHRAEQVDGVVCALATQSV